MSTPSHGQDIEGFGEGGGVELFARGGVHARASGGGDPVQGVAGLEALDHFLGVAKVPARLLIGQQHGRFQASRLQLVSMILQQVDGPPARLAGDPQISIRDGQAPQGCGEEQGGDQVLGFRLEVRIRLRPTATGGDGEVVGQFRGFFLVGDAGQWVRPPGGFLLGDLLRVENPHRASRGTAARSPIQG